ncbi:stemmadenine O-acetyltransferase-like [Corylus avellana]|uniref:stemmadenine O-acetyltransferase-like n=1 Tax=Corylus avellana TaxID=13451 RepID=UPI00286A11FD|nr:stemmadenine O-acetyltransferase-like [Corylus avellana]
MKMEVEIISKQCIKPSSPTPPNLKTYKLSLLDQVHSSIYIPVTLYYPMNESTSHSVNVADIISQRSQLLKQSLSENLTRFYPLAGKVKDELTIDCNDEGVFYLEGYSKCHLIDCIREPDIVSLNQLFPQEMTFQDPVEGDYVALIKVTSFACGGFAIGVLVCHMVADGTAFSAFLNGWAAIARKASELVYPNFDAPSIFPQNDAFSKEAAMTTFAKAYKSGRCVVTRVVFDGSAVASLKAKATSSSVSNPTRVEVVSALLWKSIMTALKATSGVQKPNYLTHSVNFRRRADPQFADSSMGNLFWGAGALCTAEKTDLAYMVSKLREAIVKVSADFVKSLQGEGGFSNLCEVMKATTEELSSIESSFGMNFIAVTSWCNFGIYDIDFGWGKPMWVSGVGSSGDTESVFPTSLILMDTRSGDGVEAWVTLNKEEKNALAQDKELLAFASLDPSPLK